ncbi:signal transduction histidine kinase [Kutzneria viridogrisea]|uniref:histidine kinase n=1 Tax=Kutzneria viridogrisea TaxID=47990 RepID=A0ABR6BME1_9PSEU|nr:signal transduction histidine kinase [Kutzneria viridogrisea]
MPAPRWRDVMATLTPFAIVLNIIVVLVLIIDPDWEFSAVASTLIQVLPAVSLLWYRRHPVGVLVFNALTSAFMAVSAVVVPDVFVPVTEMDALWVPLSAPFAIAFGLQRGQMSWVVRLSVVLMVVVAMRPWHGSFVTMTLGALFTLYPMLLGLYLGARQQRMHALTDRAERAEREQRLIAEQARAEERMLLAGEMHDIVTHRVSLMVLQAGAMGVTAEDERTRRGAEELRATGCQALDELRELVGVLRTTPGCNPDIATEVPDLSVLVAESESVGMQVRFAVDGQPGNASPVVTRTAYRIVQEGLTNVRKHARGAIADVRVSYGCDAVRLSVSNTVPRFTQDPGLSGTGGGTGLLGLRHRVELVSGSLTAGPLADGGFELLAVLPAQTTTVEG